MELKNKKVFLVGLGILGGGLSMAKYLLKKGAILTVTDLRDKTLLAPMVKKLPGKVKYVLGKHQVEDFKRAEIIIFNPAVSALSEWARLAAKLKKDYYNDYTFFLKSLEGRTPKPSIIGITGTRGKTTTALWTDHLIGTSVLGGNIPEKGLLKILGQKTDCYVLELSSFQLEYAGENTPSPHIAVITNIYNDHLNRYGKFDTYAKMKFNIFTNQTHNDFLILNADEKITGEVLKRKPNAKTYFVSGKIITGAKNGLYFDSDTIYFKENGKSEKVMKMVGLSRHEKANFLCAVLAAYLSGTNWRDISERSRDLPSAPLRQEVILRNRKLLVINDSAGTSPDATIAAIEKFSGNEDFVLLSGGTDKDLDFSELARKINDNIPPRNLYLLQGSGTKKLIRELKKFGYKTENILDSLPKMVKAVSENHQTGTIIFSPGGASFEKFKNEFDRGKKFTALTKKYFIEK